MKLVLNTSIGVQTLIYYDLLCAFNAQRSYKKKVKNSFVNLTESIQVKFCIGSRHGLMFSRTKTKEMKKITFG